MKFVSTLANLILKLSEVTMQTLFKVMLVGASLLPVLVGCSTRHRDAIQAGE
jgi:hypothetical protein